MARKLTSYERAARQREKERERQRNAARRERERTARVRDREREKAARKRANEAERAARKRAKEEELEEIKREAEESVADYTAFVESIKRLHLNPALARIRKAFQSMTRKQAFDSCAFPKPPEPEAPVYEFKKGRFKSPDQIEFDNLVNMLDFDLSGYAMHIGKKVASIPLILTLLVVFSALALYPGLWTFVRVVFGLLAVSQIMVYRDVSRGKDKTFASQKGFEAFQAATRKAHQELTEKIAAQKADFEQSEVRREAKAKKSYEEKLHIHKTEILPAHVLAELKWEKEVAAAAAAHETNEAKREQWVKGLGAGDVGTLTEALELMFPVSWQLNEDLVNTDPSDFDIGYEVVSSSHIRLCVSLPETYKFLPEYETKMKPSGREASEVLNSDAKQADAAASVVSSVALGLAGLCFDVLTTVNTIDIEVNGQSVDPSTGEDIIDLLVVASLQREDFGKLKLESLDPVEAVKKLAQGFKKPGSDKRLEPLVNRDEVLWSTLDDESVDLNAYVSGIFYQGLNKPASEGKSGKASGSFGAFFQKG